jgi:hypothetical protein
MKKLVGLFYMVVGVMLSAIYCSLAGWDLMVFIFISFIAPAAVAIWLFLLVYSGVFDGVEERKGIYSHCSDTLKEGMGEKYELRMVFWLWTAVCLLPLIMHGGSNLLLARGQSENSAWLFEYRYLSSLLLMIVAVVVPLVFGSKNTVLSIARNLWRRISF